jgi:glucose/arabinose dehydrogenase
MLNLRQIASGLTAPVTLMSAPDNTGRLFVVDQVGLVRVITAAGQLAQQPFLDVRDRMVTLKGGYDERGLLGLAFHPDYATNGRFFVYYAAPLRAGGPAGYDNTVRLSEFQVSKSDLNQADPASERIILQIDEPQANHEGGTLAFGPDGYLYLGPGDGGNANDSGAGHAAQGNGQDTGTLLGKILRLDVNKTGAGGAPYAIPPDNPFVKGGGAPEIYAYGFRNPYRFAFDRGGNHSLIAADVGQNLYEEVDVVTLGGNYGWRIREGQHCFDPNSASDPPASCPTTGAGGEPLHAPVIEQDHSLGIAIVGGYVYRGRAVPTLTGLYVFGEWSMQFNQPGGRLFIARPNAVADWPSQELQVAGTGPLGQFLLGFGQDNAGELYVLTSDASGPQGSTGQVLKIVP